MKTFDKQLRAAFDAGVQVSRTADGGYIQKRFDDFRATVGPLPDPEPVLEGMPEAEVEAEWLGSLDRDSAAGNFRSRGGW